MTVRSALITGAASGIGAEVSRRFQARGYRVLAVDRTPELAEAAAESLAGETIAIACDLTRSDEVAGLAERIGTEWSDELELLICNAGLIAPNNAAEASHEDIDRQLDVMLRSPVHLIRAALPQFLQRNRGHVMATVSLGGIIALPGSSVYSAAKAGLRAYLAAVHSEVHGTGVRVSGIYPAAVDTAMLREEATGGGSPLNFLGKVWTARDVADAYERAFDRGTLETYLPWTDSVSCRLSMWTPSLLPRLLPLLNRMGERGRARYASSIAQESSLEPQ